MDAGVVDFAVTKLDGLVANNSDWGHISNFAFGNFRTDYTGGRMIQFTTDEDFHENTRIFSNDVLRANGFASVVWYEWSGRYYLLNSGRGHHTAAIYRQCLTDRRTFYFPARLTVRSLDPAAIARLEDFWLVVCHEESALRAADFAANVNEHDRWENRWINFKVRERLSAQAQPLELLVARRDSPFFPTVVDWLHACPGSFWDLSVRLAAYDGLPRT